MVFASGVAAVIALLALATPAKKNLDKAYQGMKRMKPFPPFWDSLPTTVRSRQRSRENIATQFSADRLISELYPKKSKLALARLIYKVYRIVCERK